MAYSYERKNGLNTEQKICPLSLKIVNVLYVLEDAAKDLFFTLFSRRITAPVSPDKGLYSAFTLHSQLKSFFYL